MRGVGADKLKSGPLSTVMSLLAPWTTRMSIDFCQLIMCLVTLSSTVAVL